MNKEKVFKDAVHGYVRVQDRLIWELIQTKEFQRLRRIKQLGSTYMVFHTGEHSRFSHSLGAYEMARKMIKALTREAIIFTEEERLIVLAAALLHDIGHGPFSHTFESVLNISHEIFTARIITEDTEVRAVLENHQVGFAEKVKDVILKKYPNPIMNSIISSQLDADRLDYLLRDAYFTGTPYGEIEVQRILRTMRAMEHKLVYKLSGMHAIEDYLLSRYQMYWQVYLHPAARSFDLVTKKLLDRVRELLRSDYPFKSDVKLFKELFLSETVSIHVYLKFDDGAIFFYASGFLEEEDPLLKDFAHRFLNRQLLKEISYVPSPQTEVILKQLEQKMIILGWDPNYYLLKDYQMKMPYDYYGYKKESSSESIELVMRDGTIREISEVSDIIQGIVSGKPKKDYKIYYPLELAKEAEVANLLARLQEVDDV